MRNGYWIALGSAVGLVAGATYGPDYMIAGTVIGTAAGLGIWVVLRSAPPPRR